jgi:hypothetical protein
MSSSYNNCLRDAFLPFLHSGEFSDVEVIQGEQIYKSHKILLSAKSKFFHRLLTSDFKEAKESQVVLQVLFSFNKNQCDSISHDDDDYKD